MGAPAVSTFLLASAILIPLAIIASFMLDSFKRGLAVALFFTIGAVAGYIGGFYLAYALFEIHASDLNSSTTLAAVATGCAISGGVLATWLMEKVTGKSPWRKS